MPISPCWLSLPLDPGFSEGIACEQSPQGPTREGEEAPCPGPPLSSDSDMAQDGWSAGCLRLEGDQSYPTAWPLVSLRGLLGSGLCCTFPRGPKGGKRLRRH